jgi:hypothetical protein
VRSISIHSPAPDDARWREEASDDDIFGIARYLADAVVCGDISEEDGATALSEWAAPDRKVLQRAAARLPRDSESEHLLRAAYRHAA